MDIRNSIESFQLLKGCRVVEGFVQIVLLDRTTESNFTQLSFPHLREITSYLLLYRVAGLTSLGRLFPNLTVIRGRVLFRDYALVVFDMFSLTELGLDSLAAVERGGVRVENNRKLCFASTVNWRSIAPPAADVVVASNGAGCPDSAECARAGCAGGCWGPGPDRCQREPDPSCDRRCLGPCSGPGPAHCAACRAVLAGGACADRCPADSFEYQGRRCVSAAQCSRMRDRHQREVVQERQLRRAGAGAVGPPAAPAPAPRPASAPGSGPGSDADAHANGPAPELDSLDNYYWTFNGSCVNQCPLGFEQRGRECIECDQRCRKECPGAFVDTLAAAQNLRGCTHINGALEIQISGMEHALELSKSLHDIEEIYEFLKVWHSFSLLSLDFLARLHTIRGQRLQGPYALLVLDNPNLRQLWDWPPGRSFRVLNGSVLFHGNPRLCRYHIDKLLEVSGLSKRMHDMTIQSNGDHVTCHTVRLHAWVASRHSRGAIVQWDPAPHAPTVADGVLGYFIYYREAPAQNLTPSSGKEVCEGEGWQVKDGRAGGQTQPSFILTQLKPHTQYAFYVTTYSVTPDGASSDILYFTTLPARPGLPASFTASPRPGPAANGETAIRLAWSAPASPNGVLSHYIVWGELVPLVSPGEGRDYCRDPPRDPSPDDDVLDEPPATTPEPEREPDPEAECRQRAARARATLTTDDQYLKSCTRDMAPPAGALGIAAVDPLIAAVDVALDPSAAAVRCSQFVHHALHEGLAERRLPDGADAYPDFPETGPRGSVPPGSWGWPRADQRSDLRTAGQLARFYREVPANTTEALVTGLDYFSQYRVALLACRLRVPEEPEPPEQPACSHASVAVVRTRPRPAADALPGDRLRLVPAAPQPRPTAAGSPNASLGPSPSPAPANVAHSLRVRWLPPTRPNGPVLFYSLEWRRTDKSMIKPVLECVTATQYTAEGGALLSHLEPGQYAVRACAHSLAGPGPWSTELRVTLGPGGASGWPPGPGTAAAAALGACALLAVAVLAVCYWSRWHAAHHRMRLFATVNPDYLDASTRDTYVEDGWEVLRERVQLLGELGKGSFGQVLEGRLLPENTPCAVKMVNEGASGRERSEFLNEASVMKAFSEGHHVVRLLGVVSRGQPPLVLMELMARGDLKSFLRAAREEPELQPAPDGLLLMAAQIADGMAYLEASKFVHRDLAARNCMVAADLTVKIGDFGMTRDIYETDYYRNGSKGLLPVRWMAPESLADGVFSAQSDVWSYGVVLWEAATLAEQPYQGLANEQVLRFVLDGGLLQPPPSCPEPLLALMADCWRWRPADRPPFLRLLGRLETAGGLSDSFRQRAFAHSAAGREAAAAQARAQPGPSSRPAPAYAASCPRVCFYHSEDRSGLLAHYTQRDAGEESASLLSPGAGTSVQDASEYIEPSALPGPSR